MALKKEYYEFDPESKEIQPIEEGSIKAKLLKIDKWKVFKQIAGAIASGCASVVVSRYLKANMPDTQNVFESAVTGVGMYAITGVVSSAVSKYAEQELDEWKDSIMTVKDTVEETKGE